MENRRRPTSNSGIARGLGGRKGFASGDFEGDRPPAATSKAERVAAVRNWHDAINHFEDYADEDRLRISRFKPSVELMAAALVVLVFVGGFAAFIVALALTR